MSKFASTLPNLVAVYRQAAEIARSNAGDPVNDRNGSSSDMLARLERDLGIAAYVLNGQHDEFRNRLRASAQIKLRLLKKFESGDPISGSFVTMLIYKQVFDALAAGDLALAKDLAELMGGRDELEKKHDHPFDYAMGYALRAVILPKSGDAESWINKLADACGETGSQDYLGYCDAYRGIATLDQSLAQSGFRSIVTGHVQQSKPSGDFSGTTDELLCVWGIGLANLARSRQLAIAAEPPLIPEDLLL